MRAQRTINVPADVASYTRDLVRAGEFVNEEDVVRAAMEEWRARRAPVTDALAAVQAEISTGLADIAAGDVGTFDIERIVAGGTLASKARSSSG